MIEVNTVVRFIGGKYNGMKGVVAKVCDTQCSVVMEYEHKRYEVVEALAFVQPMADWAAGRSATETNLPGT